MFRSAALTTTTILSSIALVLSGPVQAADDVDAGDLLNLSLEQLSNISVTSVSKRSEKASEAAAAIYVITQDDIRRSGMTSIPELLRMVPGLSVAQAGAHQWAITARGFSGHFSNKLLVLIDGRSVYTPLYSGVYWDAQDTMLEDIERIEVIRGPGATLWGANAVNGVINIITKRAEDTQGTLVAATVGNIENGLVRARHGMKIGEDDYLRAYAKYDDRDDTQTTTDRVGGDAWNKLQAGFRADMKGAERHKLTLQGDVYRSGLSGELSVPSLAAPPTITYKDREFVQGANIMARWDYNYAENNDVSAQFYVDNTQRDNLIFDDSRTTFDVELQHSLVPHERHELVYGAGYRLVTDEINGSTVFSLSKDDRSDNLFSAFLQDKIAIVPDSFFITLGSKFEHNDYTGFEYQPSGRFTWLVDDSQTLWGSVARAVRTPNRFSDDGALATVVTDVDPGPGVTLGYLGTIGNPNLDSETLMAYELGYRIEVDERLSFDFAGFYNDYDNIVLGQLGSTVTTVNFPGLGAVPYIAVTPQNFNEAKSYGFEASSKWQVFSNFDLSAAYSFLILKLDQGDPFGFEYTGKTPNHQFNVRTNWFITDNIEWNNAVYYVDSLKNPNIASYARYDTRISWKLSDSLELSLVGQNLLDPNHPEFVGYVYQNSVEVPRSVYGNITWKF